VIEINPDHAEALYNLSRLLTKSDPEEANRLQARFETLQRNQHITIALKRWAISPWLLLPRATGRKRLHN